MTPPASSSTIDDFSTPPSVSSVVVDLDLATPNTIPLPVITHATLPVDTVRLTPNVNTAASFRRVQNAAQLLQGAIAVLGAIGSTLNTLNASSVDVLSLAQSIASLGRETNATAAGVTSANPIANSPSIGQQSDVLLCTRNFIGILGLMGGTATILLRTAMLSGATATSLASKDRWRLVQISLLVVVILAVIAAIGEATATLFVVHTHSTTQDDRDAQRVSWRYWVKIFARCLTIFALFLLLAALGCMKFASVSIGVTVG